MSNTYSPPALPAPDPEPEAPRRRKRDVVPWLYGFALLALAGALIWLVTAGIPASEPDPRVTALEQQVAALRQQIATLEHRPPVDIAPLAQRLAALEQHPVFDPSGFDARIARLEKKPDPSLPDAVSHPDLDKLSGRVDALAGRQDALTARQDSVEADVPKRLDTLQAGLDRRLTANEGQLTALQDSIGKVWALTDRTGRLARIGAAREALAAGRPLGELPGAPPALTRFTATKPPTESGLKLAFPAAARAALEASSPASQSDQPLIERMWTRAQAMVTVRQGDNVIVGDPAAGVIARARRALDAGDLAGAVDAVSTLPGPPAKAMADWVAQAHALLDARAALAKMAEAA